MTDTEFIRKTLRILHLEDNPRDAALIHDKLEAEGVVCNIVQAADRESYEAALAQGGFDLVLSDYNLPDCDGATALKLARERQPATPVIVISGSLGEEEAVKCLQLGANDYLLKHRLERLAPAVHRALAEAREHRRRQDMEKQLRESEEKYRLLVESAQDAIFTVDADGRFLFLNSAGAAYFGERPADLVGRAFRDLFPPSQADQYHTLVRQVMETEKGIITEIGSDIRGRHYWFSVNLQPLRDARGGTTAVQAIVRDITERKQADEALQESERRYRQLVDNALVAVYRTHLDGRILYANEALATMLEFDSPEALMATSIKERYAKPEIREIVIARLKEIGKVHNLEVEMLTRSGQLRSVLLSATLAGDTLSGMIIDVTASKQAQVALRDSQMRLQSVWEHSPDGMRLTDADGRIVEVNQTYSQFAGMTTGEMEGQLFTVAYADDRSPEERLAGYRRRFAARMIDHHLARRVTFRSGRTVEVEVSTAFLDLAEGRPPLLLSIFHDVTERKQAEEALRASEEQVVRLVDSSLDMIIAVDQERRITRFNPAAQTVFGYAAGEILGRKVDLLYADPEEGQRVHQTTVLNGHCVQEIMNRRKNGEVFPTLLAASVLREADGQLAGVMGVSRDITEQKQAQERIREQAELLDKARDAILVCDMDHRLRYWNDSAERLYGWTAEEVAGKSAPQLLFGEQPEILARAEQELQERGGWVGEMTQRTKRGDKITVESHWTLVRDKSGQPKAKLIINTDITEKKSIESQFLRTQRLESIGMLASGIAHDLNNILAPIMMSVPLLRDLYQGAEGAKILDTLETSVQRGAGLVQQVLSFARGKEGERRQIQFKHLIAEMEKIVQETFPKSIRFQRKVASDLWPVEANFTHMHQVLLNLCVNARDALPQGGRLILSAENFTLDEMRAGTLPELRPGQYILLKVQDTGTGIPSHILERIFLPFFTTKAEGQGTGLGLSTVKGIVQNHGGALGVESTVGQGTCFSIYLPASRQPAAPEDAEEEPSSVDGNGETILVTEDERGVQDVIVRLLTRHGYRVLTASDGTEAMATFVEQQNAIDLVLTDVNMPYMDGAALIRTLWKLKPDLKIVVMTGQADNLDPVQHSSHQPVKVLHKPFTSQALLQFIHQALHETKS